MSTVLLLPVLILQLVVSPVLSSVNRECYQRNKVCNSLSRAIPNSWGEDFLRFKEICFSETDEELKSFYSEGFSDQFIGTTESIFSLYSLCHESYPNCRSSGVRCHCNIAMKTYFESQGYLSFDLCRKTTGVDRRKQQGEKFFKLSFGSQRLKIGLIILAYSKTGLN